MSGHPEVDAIRVGNYLVILKCPWCGGRHYHGVGKGYGTVEAHCPPNRAPRDGGYVLREVKDGSS